MTWALTRTIVTILGGGDGRRRRARELTQPTVVGVLRDGAAALGAEGQVTMGNVVLKHRARQLRLLAVLLTSEGAALKRIAELAWDTISRHDDIGARCRQTLQERDSRRRVVPGARRGFAHGERDGWHGRWARRRHR